MCQAGSRTEAEKQFLVSLKSEVGQESKNGTCHREWKNDIVLEYGVKEDCCSCNRIAIVNKKQLFGLLKG